MPFPTALATWGSGGAARPALAEALHLRRQLGVSAPGPAAPRRRRRALLFPSGLTLICICTRTLGLPPGRIQGLPGAVVVAEPRPLDKDPLWLLRDDALGQRPLVRCVRMRNRLL